jgi:hypothetical protein
LADTLEHEEALRRRALTRKRAEQRTATQEEQA